MGRVRGPRPLEARREPLSDGESCLQAYIDQFRCCDRTAAGGTCVGNKTEQVFK